MSESPDVLARSVASAGHKLTEGNARQTPSLFKPLSLSLFWPSVRKLNLLKEFHKQCTSTPLLEQKAALTLST